MWGRHQLTEGWIEVKAMADLREIQDQSVNMPCLVFKHSTTCGISAMAQRRLISEYAPLKDKFRFYYLDLLAHRDISNEIAKIFSVRHESPQLILIQNGKAIKHFSHDMVSFESIEGLHD